MEVVSASTAQPGLTKRNAPPADVRAQMNRLKSKNVLQIHQWDSNHFLPPQLSHHLSQMFICVNPYSISSVHSNTCMGPPQRYHKVSQACQRQLTAVQKPPPLRLQPNGHHQASATTPAGEELLLLSR